MAHTIYEGTWMKRLFEDVKISSNKPIDMFCDNQAAKSITKNPMHHDITKHMEIDRHFIKKNVEDEIINSYTLL